MSDSRPAALPPLRFFCHVCAAPTTVPRDHAGAPACPRCGSDFLEELEPGNEEPPGLGSSGDEADELDLDALGFDVPPGYAHAHHGGRASHGQAPPAGADLVADFLLAQMAEMMIPPHAAASGAGGSSGSTGRNASSTIPNVAGPAPAIGGVLGALANALGGGAAAVPFPGAYSSQQQQPQQSQPLDADADLPPELAELPPLLRNIVAALGIPLNAQGRFNFSDFVFSQRQLDEIVEQLGEQSRRQPTREDGVPDAFVEHGLPSVDIVQAQVEKGIECSVCMDKFALGDDGVTKLPCDHLFHKSCLVPWLRLHRTCPTCRCDVLQDWTEPVHGMRAGEAATTSSSSAEQTPGAWVPDQEPLD